MTWVKYNQQRKENAWHMKSIHQGQKNHKKCDLCQFETFDLMKK